MARLAHGAVPTPEQVLEAQNDVASRTAEVDLGFAVAGPAALQDFDFLFPTLQNNQANLLPQAASTPARLKDLGRTMVDPGAATGDSTIPAIYTYFGQFVDHDITLESGSLHHRQAAVHRPGAAAIGHHPQRPQEPAHGHPGAGQPVRAPAPGVPNLNKMMIGRVTSPAGPRRRRCGPRARATTTTCRESPAAPTSPIDRAAQIGDPRNDENLIIAQLHVAFLKAHNALVDQGRIFAEARRILRQHYQHIVIHDFLKRIADPAIVDAMLASGTSFYDALPSRSSCRWSSPWPATASATPWCATTTTTT